MKTFVLRTLLLLLLVSFATGDLLAQTKEDLASEREAAEQARQVDRQMKKVEKQSRKDAASKGGLAGSLSFRNFVRGAVATGNLWDCLGVCCA